MILDLSRQGAHADVALSEITGRSNSVKTDCRVSRRDDSILIEFKAEDPDMPNLLATVSEPGSDRFLYEEDCVQVAIALPGNETVSDFLLANPRKSRTGNLTWPVTAQRHAQDWELAVTIPIPADKACLGLSLHRFYRGIHGEVYGLDNALPHPLDHSKFAVVLLQPDADVEDYRRSVQAAAKKVIQERIEKTEAQIGTALEQGGVSASVATAKAFVRERGKVKLQPGEGFLCWNEAYYQHALVDLWELTGERQWLELAIPRMAQVWSSRADRRGLRDSFWNEALPTWYNDPETGTACTLTTGTILDPIARLLRVIHDSPGLDDLTQQTKDWPALCQETIALHDREWVEFPDGSGMYLEPYPKGPRRVYPRGGSRICPLNRAFWLARPMLHLARILGEKEYLRKVTAMARYFKNNGEILENGSFVWEYEIGPYPAAGEDISHAHCQVLFAELCCEEGIVFTEADLRRIAVTLEKNVFRYGEAPCGVIRLGQDPGLHYGLATWSSLCRFAPQVFPKLVTLLETAMRLKLFDFDQGGWGIRCLTLLEKARRLRKCASV